MIVTVISFKGGVGKTTTAIHLAALLQKKAPTLLVDGDGIRSATKWSQRGDSNGLPFKVISYAELARYAPNYAHIVIDTEGNPSDDDFKDAAKGSDALVVPAVPESVATDGLIHTLAKLQDLGNQNYRVLLTMVPPKPRTEGAALREMLAEQEIPVFKSEIPRLAAFEKAAAEGVPVSGVQNDRNAARAWAAYEAVGKELLNG
ncbi:ParA family protein [Roseomonas sp. SSH11]|uniref:ParA family protein n=1 Tax=Pararoseomonas baculiformis TaxID=2820812 RepID=A0ABS4AJR3_9PROT|nr:ParA family protein [Pararoseomonas baculiformis]MBP0447277.1 ParA family protein [Pararoseomonas baculiformis]